MDPSQVNVLVAEPSAVPEPPVSEPSSTPKKGLGKLKVILLLIFGLTFLLVGSGVAAVAIAYEALDINNDDVQVVVSNAVVGLPFMPKTPKYALLAATVKHEAVKKLSFNLSLASESKSFMTTLGVSKIDAEAKGSIDYSNDKNINFTFNTSITKDFNMDIRKKDELLYFKVNKIPPTIFAILGIKEASASAIFDNWVVYDTSSLDTEARKSLDYYVQEQPKENDLFANLTDVFSSEIVLDKIKITDELVDNVATHKLHLSGDKEVLDYLDKKIKEIASQQTDSGIYSTEEKLSDQIKDLSLDLWVDKENYLIRKFVVSSQISTKDSLTPQLMSSLPPNPLTPILGVSTGGDEYTLVLAMKFDKYGEDFAIDIPSKALKPEEFLSLISEQFKSLYNSPSSPPPDFSYFDATPSSLPDLNNLQTN
jgi:hypothetical protein